MNAGERENVKLEIKNIFSDVVEGVLRILVADY